MVDKAQFLIGFLFKSLNNFYKTYLSFIFSLTSSVHFYLFLSLFTLFVVGLSWFYDFDGHLIVFFGTFSVLIWLVHGIHGVYHIIDDYVYDALTKSVLSTLCVLILFRSVLFILLG